jgi:hypothetical protein
MKDFFRQKASRKVNAKKTLKFHKSMNERKNNKRSQKNAQSSIADIWYDNFFFIHFFV